MLARRTERTPNRRPLNAFDQCMLSINETLQKDGNPGFETLSLFWLERKLDPSLLKKGLHELRRRHPILTARISQRWGGVRHWQWQADQKIPFFQQSLSSSDESAVLEAAETILSAKRDLNREPAVAFHRLELPDDSDVLLMHFNHALMDHSSGTLLLQEFDRLCRSESLPPPGPVQDRISEYRGRFSRRRRLKAFFHSLPDFLRDRWLPRKRWPRMLPANKRSAVKQPARLKILSREWDADETERLRNYARQVSRLPSISMTILGSAFQAFSRMIPDPRPDDLFRTGLGVEVAPQQSGEFHPQNTSSVLRLQVGRAELEGQDPPAKLLHNRFLLELKNQRDLGLVEASSLSFRSYPLVRRIAGQMIRWAFSFWYAYFTMPEDLSHDFAGVPLRRACYLGPAWSPSGLTLLATGFRGRLYFTLTYVAELVSDDEANQFLDTVLDELRSALRRPPV